MLALQKIQKTLKQQGVFVLLVLVLLFIFTLSIIGEKIPLNDGAGYDGAFYYNVAQNFSTDFWTTGYDNFRIYRIFPFCLINLIFQLFSIETTHAILMHSMSILHFFNLAIQLTFFFKLARLNAWKKVTTAIIFGCFFFNYFFLKNCGYEMFLTDAFASTVFLVSFYYLERKKILPALLISFLGILSWPTITYTIWILYFFKDPFQQTASRLKYPTDKALAITLPMISASTVGILYLLHKQPLLESALFIPASIFLLLASVIAWALFLYFVLRNCNYRFYTPLTYIREFFQNALCKKIAFIIIPFIAINLYLLAHTNDKFYFCCSAFILQIFIRVLKYPLITPVAHVCYFGILPLLVIFFFRDFSKEVFNRSPGFALAFLTFLFFAVDSEARHVIPLLPLILVPLGCVLDKINLSVKTVVALLSLQLILSHFYIPINVDGFAEAISNYDYYTVAQRYFMNFGPWMSLKSYFTWIIISAVSAFLVFLIVKKRRI